MKKTEQRESDVTFLSTIILLIYHTPHFVEARNFPKGENFFVLTYLIMRKCERFAFAIIPSACSAAVLYSCLKFTFIKL